MIKKLMANQSGLTVIEVSVATVLIGISAIALAFIFNNINGLQIGSDRLAEANAIAKLKIEELRNNHYNQLTTTNPPDTESLIEPIDFSDELTDLPEATGTVYISEPVENLRKIDVQISYQDDGEEKVVRLSSVIGALGIAQ